ncbi:MAG: hypothetical protein QNJ72_34450 [Pleurocapsa sp. MO_226.B13]|nr:hypothetical protein [Pleurocapsa sp. MO_226.B13]
MTDSLLTSEYKICPAKIKDFWYIIEQLLVQNLLVNCKKPLYIFCDRLGAKFFLQHGCRSADSDRFPQRLKVLAKINTVTRGINLILK